MRRVNLIDADSILWITTHNKVDEPVKSWEEVKLETQIFLNTIFQKCQSTHYLLFLSGPREESFRKQVFPEYKANRSTKEKPKFFRELYQFLMEEYKGIVFKGLEADDLVNIARISLQKKGDQVIVSSKDKDIFHLHGQSYDYSKDEFHDTSIEKASEFFWKDMITGQSGDGVKGIPGRGPKAANQILHPFGAEDAFIEHSSYPNIIFNEYLNHFGEYKGIQEFHKNYIALKILEYHEEFENLIPEPREV